MFGKHRLSYTIGPFLWKPRDATTTAHDAAEWRRAESREVTPINSALEPYNELVSRGLSDPVWRAKKQIRSAWKGELTFNVPSGATQLAWRNAREKGAKQLPVIVAAAGRSAAANVRRLIAASGGQTFDAIEEIGYVSGAVPIDKFPSIYASEFVTDAAIACSSSNDGCLPQTSSRTLALMNEQVFPETEEGVESKHPYRLTTRETELPQLSIEAINNDPSLRIGDEIDVERWRRQHSTWDGRGTTIAIFDGFAELSHPSLKAAKDQNGREIPKTAGIIDMDADDAKTARPDEVDFREKQLPGSCEVERRPGFRVGLWRAPGLDLCILWRDSTRTGYIFRSNASPGKYRFVVPPGKLQPTATTTAAMAGKGSVTDLILTYKDGRLFIHVANDAHTTAVAFAAAGAALPGTDLEGIAPAARIVYVSPGNFDQRSMIRGLWDALSRPDVDVASVTTAIDSFPDDRQPVLNLLLDRIGATTNKPIVMAAGNDGALLEQASGHSGSYLIAVGGTYRKYSEASGSDAGSGYRTPAVEPYSASGPRVTGGWGVDVTAPADGLTAWSCTDASGPPQMSILQHKYKTIPCWAAPGGTSIAAPRVAGVLALLVSAARQQGFAVSALELRSALIRGALRIDGVPAFRQGAGLVDIAAAWEAIQEDRARGIPAITSSTRDILPLFPFAWRGSLVGSSVYVTRGVHTGQRYLAKINLDDRSAKPFDLQAHVQSSGSDRVALRRTGLRSYEADLSIDTPHPGIVSEVVDLFTSDRRLPVARFPVLVVVTPALGDSADGIEVSGALDDAAQALVFLEFPVPAKAASISIENRWSAMGYNVIAANPAIAASSTMSPEWAPFQDPGRRIYRDVFTQDRLLGLCLTTPLSVHAHCCHTSFDVTAYSN